MLKMLVKRYVRDSFTYVFERISFLEDRYNDFQKRVFDLEVRQRCTVVCDDCGCLVEKEKAYKMKPEVRDDAVYYPYQCGRCYEEGLMRE